jgi:hypothetical protein
LLNYVYLEDEASEDFEEKFLRTGVVGGEMDELSWWDVLAR